MIEMEFFDKVKTIASDAYETAGKKGKELYTTAKIRLEIAEKQKDVKNLYKEIGFEAYKAYRAEVDVLEHITPKFKRIDALEEEIAALRERAESIKNTEEAGIDDTAPDAPIEDAEPTEESAPQQDDEEAESEPIEPIE